VHFALLRTRGMGELRREVPYQQFNHVIAYVPIQPGFPAARFYDPTADGLDVETLRPDDPGTESLVFDLQNSRHYWLSVPYQPPAAHHTRTEDRVRFDARASWPAS